MSALCVIIAFHAAMIVGWWANMSDWARHPNRQWISLGSIVVSASLLAIWKFVLNG